MINSQKETNSRLRSMLNSLLHREQQPLSSLSITGRAFAAIAVVAALTLVLVACSSSGVNDLIGSAWELALLSGNDLLPDTSITIEFSNGEVSGSAGCNHYGGSYRFSGSNFTFSDLFWTEMACPEPPGVLEQEMEYLAALNNADSYQLASDQLEIFDEAGGQLLVFVAPSGGSQAEAPPEPPEESATIFNRNVTVTPETDPTPTHEPNPAPTSEIGLETPSPAAGPPPGFIVYEDAAAGVSLFLPDSWIVSFEDPGQWAILQSYHKDKYVGGEGFQPGDTKCDLNIRPPKTTAEELIQQWKSNPETTIISEEEVILNSGETGTRMEVDNRGHSLSMFIDVHDRAVVLTCYGEFEPFDTLAASLHESEIIEDTTSSMMDSPGIRKYEDLVTGVTVDLPESWVVTGIVQGNRAVLQSYPDGKYVGGEALQNGDTKCDLSIRPPGITMADFVQEMKVNTAITILSEAEIPLASGQPGVRLEIESMGRSIMMITEINGQVVSLNCFGEFEPFGEIALTLHTAD